MTSINKSHNLFEKPTQAESNDLMSSLDAQSKVDYGYFLLRNNYKVKNFIINYDDFTV